MVCVNYYHEDALILNYTPQVSEEFIYKHLHNFYFIYSQRNIEINYNPSGDETKLIVTPFKTICTNESCAEIYFKENTFSIHNSDTLKMDVPIYEYRDGLTTRKFDGDGILVHIEGFYNATTGYSIDRGLKLYPNYSSGSVDVEIFESPILYDKF